jgi:anti-sigma factor RsiW
MTCEEFVELVTAYLEGALDATATQEFEQHLELCDGCERYLDQIRRTIDLLGEVPAEALSGAARTQLLGFYRAWSAAGGDHQ